MFDELGIKKELVQALESENIKIPTTVQQKAIPEALLNRDIIVQSETGTGKTLAFLLPIFMKLDFEKREMQAAILVPTHELAIQIQRQIERLVQNSGLKANSAVIIGNVNIERQIDKLKEKPHILVGSAGRMLELVGRKKITAHTIKTIVIDEADRMLEKSNIDNVRAFVKSTLKERQLMIFSASIPEKTIATAKDIMKDPIVIKEKQQLAIPGHIEHYYFITEQRDKIEVLRKLIRILDPEKAIVFVCDGREIETMAEKLKYHKIPAEGIHGANIKADRKKTMEDFRDGKIKILVSSDLSARGLHIEGITHIFSLDIPEKEEEYLHRAGRTGRNGNPGSSVLVATEKEKERVGMFEKKLNIKIPAKKMYEGRIMDISQRF